MDDFERRKLWFINKRGRKIGPNISGANTKQIAKALDVRLLKGIVSSEFLTKLTFAYTNSFGYALLGMSVFLDPSQQLRVIHFGHVLTLLILLRFINYIRVLYNVSLYLSMPFLRNRNF